MLIKLRWLIVYDSVNGTKDWMITANSFTKIDQLDGFRPLWRSGRENSARSRNQSDCRICSISIPPAHELKKRWDTFLESIEILYFTKIKCCLFITSSIIPTSHVPESTLSRVPASPSPMSRRPRVITSQVPCPCPTFSNSRLDMYMYALAVIIDVYFLPLLLRMILLVMEQLQMF